MVSEKKQVLWKGVYSCREDCGLYLTANIVKEEYIEGKIIINLEYKNYVKHDLIKIKKRRNYKEREILAQEIISKGVVNIQSENIIENCNLIISRIFLIKFLIFIFL